MTTIHKKRSINNLTDLKIRKLSEKGRYGDGRGLMLVVTSAGTKQWVLRIMVNGKRREIGLGGYPVISLAEAREEALRMKKLAVNGEDPVAIRRDSKRQIPTFSEAALMVYKMNAPLWKSEKAAAQWINTLVTYANPKIGNLRLNDVKPRHIVGVLEPIWTEKHETANRVRQRMSKVFDWAKTQEFIVHQNPVDGIKEALPKVKSKPVHHKAMDYNEVAAFIKTLQSSSQSINVKLGLEFLILTACRSGELRGALWSEIRLEERRWVIPAGRMKAGVEHHIPLTARAIEILSAIKPVSGKSKYVFPSSQNWNKAMSDATLSRAIQRMGFDVTVHGYRATFRSFIGEMRSYPNDVVEMALAHSNKNKVEAAYQRGDLFEKRKELMKDWENHCQNG